MVVPVPACVKLVAVLDREEGAGANLRAAGLAFTPLFTKSQLILD